MAVGPTGVWVTVGVVGGVAVLLAVADGVTGVGVEVGVRVEVTVGVGV